MNSQWINKYHSKTEKTEIFAPFIDNLLENWHFHPDLIDAEIYNKLTEIYDLMGCIKPIGDDDLRKLWIKAHRGTIFDFGTFEEYKEEGIVKTYNEFENLWKEFYPYDFVWHSLATAKYKSELFFYFDSKLLFSIKKGEVPDKNLCGGNDDIYKFLDWLFDTANMETGLLKQNEDTYNKYLEDNLSFYKRFGRIKRKRFWDILGDNAIKLDKHLGNERIDKLRKIIDEPKKVEYSSDIPPITADEFFRYCEICYDANNYFKGSELRLSPREKYTRMADGRDAGLRKILGNSQKAFHDWYHGSAHFGAHPWEICRGGNSTHISLYITYAENDWNLTLAGSSITRVEETVKMAIALKENQIPFILADADAILRMVTGNDYIGIVPDYIVPRYCHGHFPKKDKIIGFINLGYAEDEIIASEAYWYPLERIETGDEWKR